MNKLALGLLLLPPLEILTWIWASHYVGGWTIFWWTVIAFFLGLSLMRRSLASVMPQLRGGQIAPDGDAAGALTYALAGLLLAIPGLLTDVLALLLLLPPVQYLVRRGLGQYVAQRQEAMMAQMQRQGFFTFDSDGFGPQGGFGTQGGFGGMHDVFGQGNSPFADDFRHEGSRHDGTVIDGEAREVPTEPAKRIESKPE